MRAMALASGLGILAIVWLGPLPSLARHLFSAHMAMHIAVVALAAPLIATALAASRVDPVRLVPTWFAPIPASIVELVVVWGWHMPILHQAARLHRGAFVIEQVTFLGAGLLLWLSVVGGIPAARRWRAAAGVAALLFTSIHMTLLGALFALTPRPLYGHRSEAGTALLLADQHLGGAIMLLVGGASYLFGGLWLMFRVLGSPGQTAAAREAGGP